jgi:hypothetical protein
VATRFYEAVLVATRPWAVFVQTSKGVKQAQNGLHMRLPYGSSLLIAETDGKPVVIGRRNA